MPRDESSRQPGVTSLRTAVDRLRGHRGDVHGTLDELDAALLALGRERAVAAIRAFLASGTDASTGLDLKPGPGGNLDSASSLRVHLLDLLSRLDPAAAATVARELVARGGTPDEWAIALRTLSRSDPADRAVAAARLHELLTRAEWQREPTAGYLEAFDIAVALGGSAAIPDLASHLRRTDEPALAHAGFLALDRLATREPAAVLPVLLADPSLFAGREATRAGLMARADVRDPVQGALLERYLADPRFADAELARFAGVYPNDNAFVSDNLATPSQPTPRGDRAAHDLAALARVETWLSDPRFASRRMALELMRDRLRQFTRPVP